LGDSNQPELEAELRETEAAGRAIGRQILVVKVASERDLNAAFAKIVQAGAGAPLVRGSASFFKRRRPPVGPAPPPPLPASHTSRAHARPRGPVGYWRRSTPAPPRGGRPCGRRV